MKDFYLTNSNGSQLISTFRATDLMEAIKMIPDITGHTINSIVILNGYFAGLSRIHNSKCSEFYLASELPVYDLLIAEAEILGDRYELIDGIASCIER